MLSPLIRTAIPDGTIVANSDHTIDYVGGSPAEITPDGVSGTVDDAGYCGVLMNQRATDIANGNAPFYAGANKLEIWQGASGTDIDSADSSDSFCPFDTTVNWSIGDDLYIRTMTTYAIWSNHNYDSGVTHGFVTKAPASATDRLQGWFIERG